MTPLRRFSGLMTVPDAELTDCRLTRQPWVRSEPPHDLKYALAGTALPALTAH
jgi:hypothetical protein